MSEFDLIVGAPKPGSNLPELTVSELSGGIKRTLEDAYGFVRVRGELSRVTIAKSGHVYFDLKDDRASLSCVMWKGAFSRLDFRPEEGLEVVAEGKVSSFPGQSKYQLIADTLRPAGFGALMKLLEDRKKKLAAEGLFDPSRRQSLPFLPLVIGVVTSPTGAVIRDILHRLSERFPVRVLVWPSLVQGDRAAAQVSAGINGFNALPADGPIPRPDLIIVARGGGSIEDLWAFNEEIVVRAAAASTIPLISAIGHETDTTLIDYASDLRAPTPTGAAERAVPVRADLLATTSELGARLLRALTRQVQEQRTTLKAVSARLPKPQSLLALVRQRLDVSSLGLDRALRQAVERVGNRLALSAGRLRPEALSRDLARRAQNLSALDQRSKQALRRGQMLNSQLLVQTNRRLLTQEPSRKIRKAEDNLTALRRRLQQSGARRLERATLDLAASSKLLESLSHQRTLERGFVLVRRAEGGLVSRSGALSAGADVRLQFADGERAALIGEEGQKTPAKADKPNSGETARPTDKPKSDGPGSGQGSLF